MFHFGWCLHPPWQAHRLPSVHNSQASSNQKGKKGAPSQPAAWPLAVWEMSKPDRMRIQPIYPSNLAFQWLERLKCALECHHIAKSLHLFPSSLGVRRNLVSKNKTKHLSGIPSTLVTLFRNFNLNQKGQMQKYALLLSCEQNEQTKIFLL